MTDGWELSDPDEAPEARKRMRATDLKGHPCVLRVTGESGEWPAEFDSQGKMVKKAGEYLVVDAWQLDRAGIVDKEGSVRISWWRAVEQIKRMEPGRFIPCTPTEQEDRSIVLVPLSKQGKQFLAGLEAEIKADALVFDAQRKEWAEEQAAKKATPAEESYDFSDEEPF